MDFILDPEDPRAKALRRLFVVCVCTCVCERERDSECVQLYGFYLGSGRSARQSLAPPLCGVYVCERESV